MSRATGILVFILLLCPGQVLALSPSEVLVLANRNAAKSAGLARYYMECRHIPRENLVLLWMTDQETCSRAEYDQKVVPPVRRFLDAHREIRAIATFFGLPIRIAGEPGDIGGIKTSTAAFDSELALVQHSGYALPSWQPNPFFLGFQNKTPAIAKNDVLMVGRLSAPTAAIVRRMIQDSIRAETHGISGRAYFDARWPKPPKGKKLSGYARYDISLHRAAESLQKSLPVVLNDSEALFRPGAAPDTALYCGWYSLANYVDAFTWESGAVGYHMASSECITLKGRGRTWCKQILEHGACATIGPVAEPYIQAFPPPELFFGLLTRSGLTLAEVYTLSLPYLSWQMMLVGDPLYRMKLISSP